MARGLLIVKCFIVLGCLFGCATTKTAIEHDEPKIILAVEIGAKGVKGKLFGVGRGETSPYDIQELSIQQDINTNITKDYDEANNPYFIPEKIAETADAVLKIVQDMKKEYIISEENIHIFGSSALINAKNVDALFSRVSELTNKHVQFINVKDEVYFGFINNVPPEKQDSALLIDIGSGNTKMGYYNPRTKSSRSIDIPYGTKSFFDNFIKPNKHYLLHYEDMGNFKNILDGFADRVRSADAGSSVDSKIKVKEYIFRQLSADTQADILRYEASPDKIITSQLKDELVFDLNRVILLDARLAKNYYAEFAPSGVAKNLSEKNRAILDAVLPVQNARSHTASGPVFDVVGRIIVKDKLREKLEFNSDLKERTPAYIVGGIVWAFITMTKPESVNQKIVSFTYDDLVKYKNNLATNPEELFSSKRLLTDGISPHAFNEIQKIRQSVFSVDELLSGITLLTSVLEELGVTSQPLFFVRDGGWYKGAILSKINPSFFIDAKIAGSSGQNSMSRDTDEGVFEKDGRIYVKVINRSLISLIDEIAYKLRVNYTVLEDLSRYSITVFDKCEQYVDNKAFIRANWGKIKSRSFATIDELLDLLPKLKDANAKPIHINYETIGDGIIFKPSKKSYKVKGTDLSAKFLEKLQDAGKIDSSKVDGLSNSYYKLREELCKSDANIRKLLEDRKSAPLVGANDPFPEKIAAGLNLLIESGYFDTDDMRKAIADTALLKNRSQECENTICKNYRVLSQLFPHELVLKESTVGEDFSNSYKKVFLNSITSKDAEEMLKKLYFAREKEFTLATPMSGLNVLSSNSTVLPNQVVQLPQTAMTGAKYESFDKARLANDAVIAIPSQNALLIKSSREVLSLMGDIIASIDAKYPQVLIETKVFEVDDSVSRKIGTALDYSKTSGATSFGIKTIFQEGLSAAALPVFFQQYTDAEKKLSLLTNLVINDRKGLVKILAEPRIVMKPGEEAAIGLNTVKYVSIQGVQISDLKGVETGITFKITPIILSENKISLRLTIEQSEFIPTDEVNVTLSTNKNTIYTTVIADDGELISIGGIDTRRSTAFSSGVPLLKDIPIIGALFSSKTKDSNHAKIEFMIKPIIKKLNNYQKQNPPDMPGERTPVEKDEDFSMKFFLQ